MELLFEMIKFIIYSIIIVYISKNILVKLLRKLAEALDLSPKTIGSIAGIATSMPELLTVFFSATSGLISTCIYNMLSSNVINSIQYSFSILINKNGKVIRNNKALKVEIGIVVITVLIPIFMIIFGIETAISIVPVFLLLFFACNLVKKNAYRLYKVKTQSKEEIEEINKEKKWVKNKKKVAVITGLELLLTGVALFIVGDLLGNTLENFRDVFNIPEVIIGIILGFVTSIPELITFIESQRHHNNNASNTQGVIEATSNLFTSNTLNLFIIESIGILIYSLFY